MCGIVGAINLSGEVVSEKILTQMTNALYHRGPDDAGVYIDQSVGLGHRRLAITDLSHHASQPMRTEDDKYVIAFNGQVYNFLTLREQMEEVGDSFFSRSDTEVVLKLFARQGDKSVGLLNGMFAFAVWDKRARTLTLVRDRFGIKPLYYWQQGQTFLFSSEIKAFLKHPQFKVEPDFETLYEYFTFQNIFQYRSFFKGVRLLPPGHILRISIKDGLKKQAVPYWDYSFKEDASISSEIDYHEQLDSLFRQAVQRQLVSDVEIGSYLSGGIDSGAIVALASENIKQLKTFCIGFDLSSVSGLELSVDERAKAGNISGIFHTDHYERVLRAGDMKRCLPSLVWALEDLKLGQSYPNFYASKLAAQFVKVCLSGAGGDELFAGYPWRYYKSLKCRNFNDYINGYFRYWQRLIPKPTLNKLFEPVRGEVKHVLPKEIFRNVFSGHRRMPQNAEDYINQSLNFEARTFLHGLLLVEDKLSMYHGLEVRVPFLDNDLVDFAMKIPVRLKLKDIDYIINIDESELAKREKYFYKMRDGKMILRQVLNRYLGQGFTNQYKQGFCGPDANWFKGDSIDYVKEHLLNKRACLFNYLDYSTVKEIIDVHASGRQNKRLVIWSLLCFEWWLKIFAHKTVDVDSLLSPDQFGMLNN